MMPTRRSGECWRTVLREGVGYGQCTKYNYDPDTSTIMKLRTWCISLVVAFTLMMGCTISNCPCSSCQSFGGCSSPFPGQSIHPGMTKVQVKSVLGSPKSVKREGDCQILTYELDRSTVSRPKSETTTWSEYDLHFDRKGILNRVCGPSYHGWRGEDF